MGNLYMEAEQINYRNNDHPEMNTVKKALDSNQEYLSEISREVGVLIVTKADEDIIADAFSTEVSYLEGDYCINDHALYKFTEYHDAGSWDGDDVSATTLTDELKDKQDQIDDLKSGLTNYTTIASVTADGVKTASQLLSELYSHVDSLNKCALIYNNVLYSLTQRSGSHVVFSRTGNLQGTMYMSSMDITSSAADFKEVTISSAGVVAVNDYSSSVITSGKTFELVN